MKKLLGIVVLGLFIASQGQAKVKSKDINFANDFYVDSIQSCKAIGNRSFKDKQTVKRIKGLAGYDWMADWKKNSNSLSVIHINITEPILWMMTATHNAMSEDVRENIDIAKSLLVNLAKTNTLYDSVGSDELKDKPCVGRIMIQIHLVGITHINLPQTSLLCI